MMRLSIITINFNDAAGLRKTIESVLCQSAREDLEYIVVDGASSDGSVEVLQEFDKQINRWISEPDEGIYNAMNKGVAMASGDYLLFLNSGDNLLDNSVIAGVLPELTGEDLITGKMLYKGKGRSFQAKSPLTLLYFYQNSLPHDAKFIKRQLLVDVPYDESLRIVSDWKFFVQTIVLQGCSYRIIDNVISEFDTHGISARNRDLCQQERERALGELFPPRVIVDYFRFTKGGGYEDTLYDKLFVKLRDYKARRFIYALDVFILRLVALRKKTFRWIRNFPSKLP